MKRVDSHHISTNMDNKGCINRRSIKEDSGIPVKDKHCQHIVIHTGITQGR